MSSEYADPDIELMLRFQKGDEPAFEDGTDPAVLRARFLLPSMPRIFEYTWRRHMQVAARRRLVREAGASTGETIVTVGFASVGRKRLSLQYAHLEEM